jgi:hypothetical protein
MFKIRKTSILMLNFSDTFNKFTTMKILTQEINKVSATFYFNAFFG